MTDEFLGDRRRALEDAFFQAREKKEIERLRQELERKRTREELRAASGITDETTLDHMIDLGVCGQTMAAVSLVPLLWVAWADGKLDDREREAVLRAAQEKGIEPRSPSHHLLTAWLEDPPDPVLFDAWAQYARSLVDSLVATQREPFKKQIVEFAHSVAAAAGGFLGLHKVSHAEHEALDRIEAALSPEAIS